MRSPSGSYSPVMTPSASRVHSSRAVSRDPTTWLASSCCARSQRRAAPCAPRSRPRIAVHGGDAAATLEKPQPCLPRRPIDKRHPWARPLQDRINTNKINNLRRQTPFRRQKHRSAAQCVADEQQKPAQAGFCLSGDGMQPWRANFRSIGLVASIPPGPPPRGYHLFR